jgi:hypothetical protein
MSKEKSTEPKEVEVKDDGVVEEELGLTDPKEIEEALGIFDETNEEEDNEKSKDEPEEESKESEENSEEEEEEAEEPDEESKEEEKSEENSEEDKESKEEKSDEPEVNAEAEVWKKRYADSTREYETKYKPMEEENGTLKTQLEHVADLIASDPELSAMFLRTAKEREDSGDEPAPKREAEMKLPPEMQEAIDYVKQTKADAEARREKDRIEAIMSFEKDHTDLTDDDRAKLGATAGALQEKLGLSDKESLERAYLALYPEKLKEAAKGNAEKEATLNQLKKDKATSQKGPAGSGTNETTSLTAEQKVVARKFGMT